MEWILVVGIAILLLCVGRLAYLWNSVRKDITRLNTDDFDNIKDTALIQGLQAHKAMYTALDEIEKVCADVLNNDFSSIDRLINHPNNTANKVGQVLKMQEQSTRLQQLKATLAESLSDLSRILRQQLDSENEVLNTFLSSLINKIGANQGMVFSLAEQNGEQMLVSQACYAYDRKKYLHLSMPVGDGLAGQCAQDREMILMTEVPEKYMNITSGLGGSLPRCVLLMPLMAGEELMGVMELASFKVWEEEDINFIKQCAADLASAMYHQSVSKNIKVLLHEANEQKEMMQAQEEELRQNLEELHATQEEMARKQREIEAQMEYLKIVMEALPFPVFIKDEEGCYTMVNKAEADLIGKPASYILGKNDSHFVSSTKEWEVIQSSDRRIMESFEQVVLPEQEFSLEDGRTYILQTIKTPIHNPVSGKRNILGISVDLTDSKKVEYQLRETIENLMSRGSGGGRDNTGTSNKKGR